MTMRLFEGTQWDRPPLCERCGELDEECRCPPAEPEPRLLTPPEQQTARLSVEKRRKGKVVTVVSGLAAEENDFPALLGELKAACGAGGSIQDDRLEIQGRQTDRVREVLQKVGYRVTG